MKRFKFKYHNILKLRLDFEDDIKKQLKQANLKLTELEETLDGIEQAYRSYRIDVQNQLSTGLKGAAVAQINHFQLYYRDAIREANLNIRRQEDLIERIKVELAEAIKERKIMEKLKEKALERHHEEMKFQEIKETDEIVNFQNSKRSGD